MTERFSVVVPVYGNQGTLRELKDRLSATFREMGAEEVELIFVDDASPDGSWAVIESLAMADPRVVGLRLGSNVGQVMAYCAGIDAARGDVLMSLDADLEHPPEAIPRLVGAIRQGHDLVVAHRVGRAPGRRRLVGTRVVNLLARTTGLSVSDVGSSFIVATPEVAGAIRQVIERTGRQMILPTIVAGTARHPAAVDVEMAASPTSAYTLRRTIGLLGEFLAAELGPALARRMLLVSAGAFVVGIQPRRRRGALRFGAVTAGLGLLGLLVPYGFRRDRAEPMYVVATRVGQGLGS